MRMRSKIWREKKRTKRRQIAEYFGKCVSILKFCEVEQSKTILKCCVIIAASLLSALVKKKLKIGQYLVKCYDKKHSGLLLWFTL